MKTSLFGMYIMVSCMVFGTGIVVGFGNLLSGNSWGLPFMIICSLLYASNWFLIGNGNEK